MHSGTPGGLDVGLRSCFKRRKGPGVAQVLVAFFPPFLSSRLWGHGLCVQQPVGRCTFLAEMLEKSSFRVFTALFTREQESDPISRCDAPKLEVNRSLVSFQ